MILTKLLSLSTRTKVVAIVVLLSLCYVTTTQVVIRRERAGRLRAETSRDSVVAVNDVMRVVADGTTVRLALLHDQVTDLLGRPAKVTVRTVTDTIVMVVTKDAPATADSAGTVTTSEVDTLNVHARATARVLTPATGPIARWEWDLRVDPLEVSVGVSCVGGVPETSVKTFPAVPLAEHRGTAGKDLCRERVTNRVPAGYKVAAGAGVLVVTYQVARLLGLVD